MIEFLMSSPLLLCNSHAKKKKKLITIIHELSLAFSLSLFLFWLRRACDVTKGTAGHLASHRSVMTLRADICCVARDFLVQQGPTNPRFRQKGEKQATG